MYKKLFKKVIIAGSRGREVMACGLHLVAA